MTTRRAHIRRTRYGTQHVRQHKMTYIAIKRPTRRAFGLEYPIEFIRNGKRVGESVVLKDDLPYAENEAPAGMYEYFKNAPKIRK